MRVPIGRDASAESFCGWCRRIHEIGVITSSTAATATNGRRFPPPPRVLRASGRPSASTAVLSAAGRGRPAACRSRIALVRGPDSSALPRPVRGSATEAAAGCAYDVLGVTAADSNPLDASEVDSP